MINITIREAVDSITPLKEVLTREVNGRTAFTLARIIREIDKIYQDFSTSKNKLIEKYAEYDEEKQTYETDENGNTLIPNAAIPEFNNEFNALLSTSLQLAVEPITVTDIEQLNFTPEQMLHLLPFIKE